MKSRMVLVAILLMLYIGPSIFMVSYVAPTTPTEQNSHKEFSLSADAWLTGWTYRKAVLIDGVAGAGTNYQINITIPYDSNMQTDYDDIRFTAFDNITLLDHWRESYTASTTALFWVEVSANLDSNKIITMYWGNDEVSDASDGHATFLFYEDWSEQSTVNWTIPDNQADGTVTYGVGGDHGGYIAKIEGDSEDSIILKTNFNTTAPFSLMFRANIEETTTGNTARVGTGWAGAYGWAYVQGVGGVEHFAVYDDGGVSDNQVMDATYYDSYITFEILRGFESGGGDLYAKLIADGVEIEIGSFDPDAVSNPVMAFQNVDSEDDIYSDWVATRKYIGAGAEPAFNSFGAEENNFIWQLVEDVDFIFLVPADLWAWDMFLILLGLCMVPASTVYLVYGGKNAMSTDKLFYGLIFFLVGWGFIIGGIL